MRIFEILNFLMPSLYSLSSASISFCINSLYNYFASILVILRVVTSIQFFCIFHIISFVVYDSFRVIIILIVVNVSCQFFKFISNHNNLGSSLSLFSLVDLIFPSLSQYFLQSTLIFVFYYYVF